MSHKKHHHNPNQSLEREAVTVLKKIEQVEEQIEQDLHPRKSELTHVQLAFGGTIMQGPLNINVGQKTKATVLGFDQNGAAFTGVIPAATYTIDNSALDSSTADGANGSDIVSLAAGTANLSVSLTSAEGLALSDTAQIINAATAQVLSSVKLDFSQPA